MPADPVRRAEDGGNLELYEGWKDGAMPVIECQVCGGMGYYCPGTANWYDGSPDEVGCEECEGEGYLPLLGWAVLDSTYGSRPNRERRHWDALAREAAESGAWL